VVVAVASQQAVVELVVVFSQVQPISHVHLVTQS
jgi:hypothetical protein